MNNLKELATDKICHTCCKGIDTNHFLQTSGLYFCSEECFQRWEDNQILVGGNK
jgi:YHS domain-containing protein